MSAIYVCILIFLLVATIVLIIVFLVQLRKQRAILNDLIETDKVIDQLFPRKDNALWVSNGREVAIDKEYAEAHKMGDATVPLPVFYSMVHPDCVHHLTTLMEYPKHRGRFVMRMQLTFDGGKTWSWHEMSYTSTDETARTRLLPGYMRSINQEIEEEKKLDEMYQSANQMVLKQEFLANMTTDISTPLDTIKEQSMLLIGKSRNISLEEGKKCRDKVNESIQNILEIIKNAMDKATKAGLSILLVSMLASSCSAQDNTADDIAINGIGLLLILLVGGIAILIARYYHYIKAIKKQKLTNDRRINGLIGAGCSLIGTIADIQQVLNRVHPDYREDVIPVQEALSVNDCLHDFNVYADISGEGDDYRWWKLRFIIHDTKTKGLHLDGLLIDVTDSVSRSAQLRAAIKELEEKRKKTDFLTTISHEIRTPLNAVQGFCEILATTPSSDISDEDFKRYSRLINDYYDYAHGLLQNIKLYSLSETGQVDYNMEVFDTIPLIEEIAEEWRTRMPNEIEFTSPIFYNHVFVNADKEKVRYILNGLLDNAVKFTKTGRISIFTAYNYANKMVAFCIVDTGCGIAADRHEYVFELFSKVDSFVPGLGLGLNLAQRVAKNMGGYIKLDSELGVGTNAFLYLPAQLQ